MNHSFQQLNTSSYTHKKPVGMAVKQHTTVGNIIQPKLTIGAPNDKYEQEADQVADQVMRMPNALQDNVTSTSEHINPIPIASTIQRKCAGCDDEDKMLQKKSQGLTPEMSATTAANIQSLKGKGQSMSQADRRFFEPRFGTDFSNVRLHTDHQAANTAQSINARAFTLGNNIVFNTGQYSSTPQGRHLMAHELTHTIQQKKSTTNMAQRKCGASAIGQPQGCAQSTEIVDDDKYLFKVNCDDFRRGNELDLRSDAQSIKSGDVVEIHGYASIEGDATNNLNLSCARALRAKTVITDELSKKGVTATIRVYKHGATEGNRDLWRSVIVTSTTSKPKEKKPKQPDYNEKVLIWLNAFIPGHVPGGTQKIAKGSFKGKTCINAPIFGCALSDQRSFSKSRLAKSRMRLFILADLKTLTFQYGGMSDYTHHVNLSSGKLKCKDKSKGKYRVDGKIMSLNPDGLGMKFIAAANNPCALGSPNIDFMGRIGLDRKTRQAKVEAWVDGFPAYEMYISSTKTGVTNTLFTAPPICNDSRNVWCLFPGPRYRKAGTTTF